MASSRRSAVLLLVYGNIIVYAFAYWMTNPVMPYLSASLNASPITFGYLTSFFSFVQLVGGPVIGRVIDTYGALPALVLSQLSGAAGYLLLAVAYDVRTLFLSRLPTLGMHAMHAAQAMVAILTEEESRAAAIGRLSLMYGVGFALGPLAGGVASKHVGYQGTAALAGLLSLALAAATAVFARGVGRDGSASDGDKKKEEKAGGGLSLSEVLRVLRLPVVPRLLTVKVVAGLAVALFHSGFSSAARDTFSLTAEQSGFVMSFVGVLSIAVNSVVVGALRARFSARAVILGAMVVLAASFGALRLATGLYELLAVTAPLVSASTVLMTTCTASLTTSASKDDAGTVLGLDMFAGTAARLAAPIVAGHVLESLGFAAISPIGASLAAAALALAAASSGLKKKRE